MWAGLFQIVSVFSWPWQSEVASAQLHTQEFLQGASKVLDIDGAAHSFRCHGEWELQRELASITVTEVALQVMLSPERCQHPSHLPWFCAFRECTVHSRPLCLKASAYKVAAILTAEHVR